MMGKLEKPHRSKDQSSFEQEEVIEMVEISSKRTSQSSLQRLEVARGSSEEQWAKKVVESVKSKTFLSPPYAD